MNTRFSQVLCSALFSHYRLFQGVWLKGDVGFEGYAANFGIQWNKFRSTQHDSITGYPQTNNRLFGCTGWHPSSLKDKLVLEIGSGSGRFTEILLAHGACVVSVDISNAVFANHSNNACDNLLLIRSSIDSLPLNKGSFDFVLCYGVVQHTPSPELSYLTSISYVKEDGMCAFDHYQKFWRPRPWYFPKYLWRPLTTRISPTLLLRILEIYIPVYFPIDTFIKRIPRVGSFIAGILPFPCWNYSNSSDIDQSYDNLIKWAIVDTYDALGARYDQPWSLSQLAKLAQKLPVKAYHIGIGGNGILLNTYGNNSLLD